MAQFVFNKNLCPSALMGINSDPVMAIIMIIMSNRGQACGLCEVSLEELCLIFSVYGCMLLNSHWNQWDSFRQLPWFRAGALNGLLQQRKINIVVGSSSADDRTDALKSPSTFPGVRGGRMQCWLTTVLFFLGDNFRASQVLQAHNILYCVITES